MKEILIVSNYYPPETGAAANRIAQLASGLETQGYKLTVVCPLPNYPRGKIFHGYRGKFKSIDQRNRITTHRLWLYPSVSKNKLIRLFSMLSFSFSLAWFLTFSKVPKIVIVQSPPLIVAFTAILFLKKSKRKLVLNISDLWPLAGAELNAYKQNSLSYKCLHAIEKYIYRKADLVLGQSQETISHVTSLYPNKKVFLYRNYPNFNLNETQLKRNPSRNLKLVYAGLLGVAQGIHKLCESLNYHGIELHLYGSGAEQKKIEQFIRDNSELPIYYHGEKSRTDIHHILLEYDLALIPLLNRIYGSVPSKLFEYAKLGLPVIYFGGGEGESIVNQYNLGWVAEAGNYEHLNAIIQSINPTQIDLSLKKQIRNTANSNFDFEQQLMRFSAELDD